MCQEQRKICRRARHVQALLWLIIAKENLVPCQTLPLSLKRMYQINGQFSSIHNSFFDSKICMYKNIKLYSSTMSTSSSFLASSSSRK